MLCEVDLRCKARTTRNTADMLFVDVDIIERVILLVKVRFKVNNILVIIVLLYIVRRYWSSLAI